MNMSTIYVLGGLAFNVIGGLASVGVSSPAELVLAAALLFVGTLLVTIGAIAKGVSLGMYEHDEVPAPKPHPKPHHA